jgi:hypothetical protein
LRNTFGRDQPITFRAIDPARRMEGELRVHACTAFGAYVSERSVCLTNDCAKADAASRIEYESVGLHFVSQRNVGDPIP